MEEGLIRKKCELMLGGPVRLPEGFVPPVRLSRSTAGPGAGSSSMVLAFGGMRIKKAVSREEGEFLLRDDGGRLSLLRGGEPFLDGVRIEPVVYHSPEQAFFNLDQRCMFDCVYCASPHLGVELTKGLTDAKIVAMVAGAMESQEVKGVALTSGVRGSVRETAERFASCVRALRGAFPDVPIGVEPYVDDEAQVDAIRAAGADEIKINCEAATEAVFRRSCPGLDYGNVFRMLEHAVGAFGRGRVASNVIYGLGETDAEVEAVLERLASMGVAPGLRALKVSPSNEARIAAALGDVGRNTPERAIKLARLQKAAMERHGLTTLTFRTMCFPCTCCDLVPFRDLRSWP